MVYGTLLLRMEPKEENAPISEPETVPPDASLKTPKQKSWLSLGLIVLILLLLGITGYLAYQNHQVKRQLINQRQSAPTPLPKITKQPETSTPTPSNNLTTSWKTYSSEFTGISLRYPQDAIFEEHKLDAILTIKYSNNKYKNYELQDGYLLSILYTPIDSTVSSVKERAEQSKSFESERCSTSPIFTTRIDNQEAYFFHITGCPYKTTIYFVRGTTHQYEIRATHYRNTTKYMEITKKIINSIKFL